MIDAVNAALDAADDSVGLNGGVGLDSNDPADLIAPDDVVDMTTDEMGILTAAKAAIKAITDDPQYTNPGVTGGDANTLTDLKGLVSTANTAIAHLENAIGVVNGTTGSVNSFYGTAADISVMVVFRATATRGADSNRDGSITGEEERSTLKVARPPSKTNGEAAVQAIIEDEHQTRLAGFVDFTIEGDDEVVFKESSRKTFRKELVNGSTSLVVVKGLSKTDPVRVKVTADFNNGELIQTVYLSRIGNATDIAATAYSCMLSEEGRGDDSVDGDDALTGGVCDYEIKSLISDKISSNDPDELVSIGAEGHFFIAGTAKDALSSTVDSLKSGNLTWKAADADARAVLRPDDGNANTAIQIDSDAEPGTYNITVEDSGKDASITVMVTVAGDASMISVSCDPMMIPTDTGLTDCTVVVTDAGGNIPSNLDTEIVDTEERDQVQVSVRGSSDIKADLIGAKDGLVNLDAKGMATFSIQLPLDAVEGSSITVNVSASIDDELLRNHTVVTYGDPSTEPGTTDPGTMDELAAPTGVVVSLLQDTISVTWDQGPERRTDQGGGVQCRCDFHRIHQDG